MRLKFNYAVLSAAILISSGLLFSQEQSQNNARQPKIFAQKLVDDTLAKHKDVVIMAFHVTPPNQSDNVIIASNIGRIGKKADEDDMRVIDTGKSNLEVNKAGNHFEDELPLLDAAGHRIGAVGIVFNYKSGDDKQKLARRAEQVRDEMSTQISSKDRLFEHVE